MKRRVFVPALGAIAVSIAAVPQRVGAQAAPRVPRIGVLRWGTPGDETRPALTAALASLGYQEGRTIHIEWRWATRADVAQTHAVELAGLGLDLIVGSATPAALALRDARVAVPVVFGTVADPVGAGLVPSLARPGGNMTGVSTNLPAMVPKQLQLLREALPGLQRVAFLGSTQDPATRLFAEQAQALERALDAFREALAPGGVMAILSYHSLEDRMVKDAFREAATGGCTCPSGLPCACGAEPTVRLIRRGAWTASDEEISSNRRAESVRLRVVERLGEPA
jgi:hypothetical protein